MRKIVAPAAAFALLALGAATLQGQGTATERVSQTLPLEPGGTLRVNSFSGRVTITPNERPEVVVEAVRHGTREQLDDVKLKISSTGSVVVIEENQSQRQWFHLFDWTRRSNAVNTDFDIKAPRETNINVSVFSAAVTVRGIEGAHRVRTFSSRVQLEEVAGSVDAHSFSGAIDISATKWLENQRIDVDTFSGRIGLRVPDSAQATVQFDTFSGRLTSERPLTLSHGNKRSLTARLGDSTSGARLRFKTFSGDVRIDR